MPERIQLHRTRGWRMPPNTVMVARYRGDDPRWGNPFDIGPHGTREQVIAKYREWIVHPEQAHLVEKAKRELRGKNLACWCALDQACHADVLLMLANI